jgi:hypothetical protein
MGKKAFVDHRKKIEEKYKKPSQAICDAAFALFKLNRYAKHISFPQAQHKLVYELKDRFIRYLYEHGYCEKTYLRKKTVRWYVFRFNIEGRMFTWHQPEDKVDFPIRLTEQTENEMNQTEIKSLEISSRKLAEAKVLIKWILENDQQKLADIPEIQALTYRIPLHDKYYRKFEKRYKSPTQAVHDAAFALFNLNRYAKHLSCSLLHRKTIYALKDQFIRYLYEHEYCETAYLHTRLFQWYEFSFNIDGQHFTWHQREDFVEYPVHVMKEFETEIDNIENQVEPMHISYQQFREAKSLINWVLECEE